MKIRSFFLCICAALLTLSCSLGNNEPVTLEESVDLSLISKFSGEELFKGIFFLDQTFAENVGILSNSILYGEIHANSMVSDNMDAASELIIEQIKLAKPDFFETFETKLKSGDEYYIQLGIEEGTQALNEVFEIVLRENNITHEQMAMIISQGDYDQIVDETGTIDTEALNAYFDQVDSNIQGFSNASDGRCLAAAIVAVTFFVAGVYVLVGAVAAVVAAVNGGVAVNLGAAVNVYAAVNVQVEINADYRSAETETLPFEIMVNQIAQLRRTPLIN